MRRLTILLCLALVAVTSSAQEVVTTTNLNLRSGPTTDSRIVYQVPKGTVLNLNNCQTSWCQVNVSGYSGYIAKRYTTSATTYQSKYSTNSTSTVEPTGAVKYYKNSKGETVQSPTRYNAPPAGATAECRDGTYSFSRSRRGTCSHHGGVKRWLK